MATRATETLSYPQWTTLDKKRGLDPLGMQVTSVALYQQLVPGISNVTLRMRYYGLYAWLADWYAKNVGETDIEQWCRYVRRTEALYALAAQLAGNERGIPGSRWAGRTLGDSNKISFSTWTDRQSDDQYLKQKFGAFGAAYGSQLLEVGVLRSLAAQEGGHNIQVPSSGLGDELAESFGGAVGDAARVFTKAIKDGVVTRSQLEQIAPMLPSEIAARGRERQIYEDMLFGARDDRDRGSEKRARTLRLVLRMAAEYEAPLNADMVRWSLYAGERGDGTELQPMAPTEREHAFLWAVYQANDMLHACYETLLRYTLDVLDSFPQGMPMTSLLELLVRRVTGQIKPRPASWERFVEGVREPRHRLASSGVSEFALSQQVLETNTAMGICGPEAVQSALTLMALIYKRFLPELPEIRRKADILVVDSFSQSLVSELDFLAARASASWEGVLNELFRSRVLERHIWVAMQKLRAQGDYTFLIEADNGRLRLKQKDGPVFTNPRLGPAITFLEDIHLLGEKGPTARGRKLMEVE